MKWIAALLCCALFASALGMVACATKDQLAASAPVETSAVVTPTRDLL